MPFATDSEFTITQVSPILWRLESDLIYYDSVHFFGVMIVPKGFTCDGSSIPRVVWSLIGHPLYDDFGVCGFLHDMLYRIKYDRKISDLIYIEALKDLGTPAWKRKLCYWVLRLFGGFVYGKEN